MSKALALLLLGILLNGCTGPKSTGVFLKLDQLETQLERGKSTKDDVSRLLGHPNGSGHAAFPLLETVHEIWYYEDLEVTDTKSQARVLNVQIRQQILMVFFKGERFDGFLWTSNSGAARGEERFQF